MFCLAHRRLGLPDLIHRSSSPWSACLVQRPLGQRPGSGQGGPAAWGDHKRHQKTTSAWNRQMNVFIYLPPSPNYPQTQSTAWVEMRQRGHIGEGGRRGPSCIRNLSSLLGGVCSVSQHLHDQFPELKLPGVLILPLPVHLCPEGPFQMDTNCGGCTLLAAPMPPGPRGPASQSLNWQGPVCI